MNHKRRGTIAKNIRRKAVIERLEKHLKNHLQSHLEMTKKYFKTDNVTMITTIETMSEKMKKHEQNQIEELKHIKELVN